MDAILIIAMDGRIVEANTAACHLYGYDPDEMLGLNSEVLMHPDSLYKAGEIVSAIREGRVYESTQLAIRKDGTVFHTEGRATAFMHGGELHILSMERDISTRIRTEDHRTHELARGRRWERVAAGYIVYAHSGSITYSR